MKNLIVKISNLVGYPRNKELYIKILVALLLFVWVFFLSTEKFRKKKLNFKVGDIAPYDIKINRDTEYVDQIETQKSIQNLISNISPVFSLDKHVLTEQEQNIDVFFNTIERIDGGFHVLSEKVREAKKNTMIKDEELLSKVFMTYRPDNLRNKLIEIVGRVYRTGITDMGSKDIDLLSKSSDIIKISRNEKKEEVLVTVNRNDLLYRDELNFTDLVKRPYVNLPQEKVLTLSFLLRYFIKPNLLYNKIESDKKIVDIINLVKPVKKKLKQGQVLVRYGQEITEADFSILKELVKYSTQQNVIEGYFILLLLIFFLIFFLIKIYIQGILQNLKRYLFFASFIFLAASLNSLFIYFNNFLSPRISNSSFIPIAGFAILITSLADLTVSYFVVFFISVLTMFITGFNFVDFMTILSVGVFIIVIFRSFRKRSAMWYLALLTGVLYALLSIVHAQINSLDRNILFNYILIGFINGIVSSIIAIGLYPLFENIFNVVTDYKLIELSDLNSPIMKKLLIEAPGTYHHSIITANLAETAALTIGANSLLARVCGYYHDIGKLENPEYFIENQVAEENRHDNVKPSISCSIIKSHIKYGIEVAKKLKLPEEIMNAIREHHGTTMIHYFYKKALMDKEIEKMSKEDLIAIYRHDGPLPRSKESAIIMLADAVEAATRSLRKPSFSRIETIIREIMNARFLDGQLNDCPLTLKDLEKITKSFIQFLSAMYHTRIEYPDKDEIKKLENEYQY